MITNVSVESHECVHGQSLRRGTMDRWTEQVVNHFTKCELCLTWSDVTEIVVTGPSTGPLHASRDLLLVRESHSPLRR